MTLLFTSDNKKQVMHPVSEVRCDIAGLRAMASELATCLKIGDIICLKGDLGVGKTTFAKMLISEFGINIDQVTSPTFNILSVYESGGSNSIALWHFDLYRLGHVDEIYQLGMDEAFASGITVIEWPEIIETLLPKHVITVNIDFAKEDDFRLVSISKVL